MYTRMLEFKVKPESTDKLSNVMNEEILPVLKKQKGFVDIIALRDEADTTICTALSFWTSKADADRYATETYPKVAEKLKPHMATNVTMRTFNVETSTLHKIAGIAA